MKKEDHILITKLVFGKSYDEVHQWLDECYPKYMGFEHWRERHHKEAIMKQYGKDSHILYDVACFHVLCDFLSHLHEWMIPDTEQDVLDYFGYSK